MGRAARQPSTATIAVLLIAAFLALSAVFALGAHAQQSQDTSPPQTVATNVQGDNHTVWVNSSKVVTLTATDDSGVASTVYRVDGGGWTTYTSPFTVSGAGSHTVSYYSTDIYSNVEATRTGYVNIDTTPPTTASTNLQTTGSTGWVNSAQTVTLNPNEPGTSAWVSGTFAGAAGQVGDTDGTGSGARLKWTDRMTIDSAGNVYFTQMDNVVRKMTPAGVVTTVAGTAGASGSADGTGAAARFNWCDGIAVDSSGNLYVADLLNSTVRKITPGGVVTTLAGTAGQAAHVDATGAAARFWEPRGIAVDPSGNVYVSDGGDATIRKITPAGVVTTVAGSSGAWGSTDGTGAAARFEWPSGLTFDSQGNLIVADGQTIRKVTLPGAVVTTIAGTGYQWGTADGTGAAAQFETALDITKGPDGNFYVTDEGGQTIREVTLSGVVTTLAGNPLASGTADGVGGAAYFGAPYGIAANSAGLLYISDDWNDTIRTLTNTVVGAATTKYQVDAGSTTPYTIPFLVSGAGSHTITYCSIDAAGNQEATKTGYVNIDAAAPTTAQSGLQANTTTGWRNSSQTVTLTPSDTGGSGLATTKYQIDAGALTTYGAPFAVSGAGNHTITYSSTDYAGNVEATKTGYVNIDTTAPTTSQTGMQASNNTGWINSQTVTLTGADTGGSGLAITNYKVDSGSLMLYAGPFLVSAAGSHTITYYSTDNAGNVEATKTGYVNIDTTAPVTSPTGLQASNSVGWRNTTQSVTLPAADTGGGALSATYYKLDGAGQTTYSSAFNVSGQGQHTVEYWSTDTAGNTEVHRTGYVNIDTTLPTTAATNLQANGTTGWTNAAVIVTLAPSDTGGSAVASTKYQIDAGTLTTYTVPFAVSGAGSHAITYYSIDNAGNQEATKTGYVNIDTTAPVTSPVGLQASNNVGWRNTTQSVTLPAADTGGGALSATYYKLDGGGQTTYVSAFNVSGQLQHTIEYWSTDTAGNSEAHRTGYVNIDTTLPTTAATNLQVNGTTGWTNASVTVTLTPSDTGGSGTASTKYQIDAGTLTTYTVPFAVSGAGSHAITYYATDNAGNVEATKTGYVNIDTTAPTTAAINLQAANNVGWTNAAVTVTLTPSDTGGSGTATTKYQVDAGVLTTYSTPFVVSAAGSHTITYYSTDNAGNVEATKTGYVNIDTTAPTTTATGLQASNNVGWSNTSVSVNFTPSDTGGSGWATTKYTIDGGALQTFGTAPLSGTPFIISAPGSHTITYYSIDAAGNVEATKAGYININIGVYSAPPGTVSTFAGSAGQTGNTDATGAAARFSSPYGTATDSSGNVYVADYTNSTIRKITPAGVVTTFAGTAGLTGSTDATGAAARFKNPSGVATDSAGNVYVADFNNNAIRKITPAGVVTTLAGTAGTTGSTDATGAAARFNYPSSLACDLAGNVYVVDEGNNTIRTITPAGVVTTLAGTAGQSGSTDATGAAARFSFPWGIACDSGGTLYVTDYSNDTIRKITPAGVVTTLAGTAGQVGSADGTGAAAQFWGPLCVAFDPSGTLYVTDSGNNTIRKVTAAGVVTTLSGTGAVSGSADGTGSVARFNLPSGIAIDPAGDLFVADRSSQTIREIVQDTTPPVTTASGLQANNNTGWTAGPQLVTLSAVDTVSGAASTTYAIDGGAATPYSAPFSVSAAGSHAITYYSTDVAGNVEAIKTGYVNINLGTYAVPPYYTGTFAGSAGKSGETDATGSVARFSGPSGVATDSAGNVYISDYYGETIRKVTPAGVVTTLAGSSGVVGSTDATGSAASFNGPYGLATDSAGNVYVADRYNDTIRKITPAGVVTTLAGSAGLTGSTDAAGSAARFSQPMGLATDSSGNVYVGDWSNQTIRKITPAGVVTTLAGTAGSAGWTDGTGSAARFYYPIGVATDSSSNVYVADTGNDTIRKITPAGVVTTLAGSVRVVGSIDGSGTAANFNSPYGVTTDSSGNVYVVDFGNSTIRKITSAGVVTTVAGTAMAPGSADGVGAAARFSHPNGLATDSGGTLYVADQGNYTIRRVVLDTTAPVTTATGLMTSSRTGWVNGSQPVTLAATDAGSGVALTTYTIDGGASTPYSTPFTISAVGSHTVSYFSTDNAGNVERTHTGYVNIGAPAPAAPSMSTGDGGWLWQNALPEGNTTRSTRFVDATHGWAVGDNGTILVTSNGGATWTGQASGTANLLWSVTFTDASHGWAVGANGTILATSNGGATWTAQSSGTAQTLLGVAFTDASHGWAVGNAGTILATVNGGATWTAQTSGTANALNGVTFTDASHGWAVGSAAPS